LARLCGAGRMCEENFKRDSSQPFYVVKNY